MENQGCCMVKPAANSCSTEPGSCGPKKGCCGTLVKGAILGSIIMFLYFSASWMLLPWHKTTMMSFTNEKVVAMVLNKNAEKSGVYVLPSMPKAPAAPAATPAGEKAAPVKAAAPTAPAVDKPFAFVSIFADGVTEKDMNRALVKQFVLCLFGAFLLTCLLKKSSCCGCPILSSLKIGLLVAVFHYVPNMIWFHFPLNYSLVGMADDVLAFTLAGIIISKCFLKKSSCSTGK